MSMPVSEQELSTLTATHDIITLGILADDLRRARHGLRTTFVRVALVDARVGAQVGRPAGAGELRITGVPASRADAVARVREVVEQAGGVPVSAFSLGDVERLAAREQTTLRAVLEELRAAGLELVAEAPYDDLQDPRRSIEEVNIAGLALARLTLTRLPSADVTPLFRRIADLQRDVAVIRSFAPLPRKVNPAVPSTGYEDVTRIALARLILNGIASIQVDWALYGPKLAQVALTVGADDVDAVSPEEETGQGRRRAPLEEIKRNIRAAGQEPVERNGRFETPAR
jgi:CofH/MqnC C-terminal region